MFQGCNADTCDSGRAAEVAVRRAIIRSKARLMVPYVRARDVAHGPYAAGCHQTFSYMLALVYRFYFSFIVLFQKVHCVYWN